MKHKTEEIIGSYYQSVASQIFFLVSKIYKRFIIFLWAVAYSPLQKAERFPALIQQDCQQPCYGIVLLSSSLFLCSIHLCSLFLTCMCCSSHLKNLLRHHTDSSLFSVQHLNRLFRLFEVLDDAQIAKSRLPKLKCICFKPDNVVLMHKQKINFLQKYICVCIYIYICFTTKKQSVHYLQQNLICGLQASDQDVKLKLEHRICRLYLSYWLKAF